MVMQMKKRHLWVRLVQEGPTLLLALDAHLSIRVLYDGRPLALPACSGPSRSASGSASPHDHAPRALKEVAPSYSQTWNAVIVREISFLPDRCCLLT